MKRSIINDKTKYITRANIVKVDESKIATKSKTTKKKEDRTKFIVDYHGFFCWGTKSQKLK